MVISLNVLSTPLWVRVVRPWKEAATLGRAAIQRLVAVGCSGTSRKRSNFASRIMMTPGHQVDLVAPDTNRIRKAPRDDNSPISVS